MTDQQGPNQYPGYGVPPSGPGTNPSGGYGNYGSFGEQVTSPSSQPSYSQPPAYAQTPAPVAPKKPRRGLKIALIVGAIVLVLGVVGGAGAFILFNQIAAPGVAALQFCSQLKAQKYDDAYGMLSSTLQAKYTKSAFSAGVAALDTAEGKVTNCQQGSGTSFSLGSSTATIGAQLTRSTQGNLTGSLHMKNQNGSWKVDGIDTSLLGVNIDALQASGAFCAAMQGADYATAYGLLSSAQQGLVSQDDFVASGKLHDQIDGALTKCALVKVPQGNNDQITRLTIDMTRAKLGDRTGDVTLKLEGTAWKVDATDAALNGTDLRPLVVGGQFCTLMGAGKYADAYNLFSTAFQGTSTSAEFAAAAGTYNGMAVKWTCGTPDFSTYTVTSDHASIVIPITVAIPNLGSAATSTNKYTVMFVMENGTWKIDDLKV